MNNFKKFFKTVFLLVIVFQGALLANLIFKGTALAGGDGGAVSVRPVITKPVHRTPAHQVHHKKTVRKIKKTAVRQPVRHVVSRVRRHQLVIRQAVKRPVKIVRHVHRPVSKRLVFAPGSKPGPSVKPRVTSAQRVATLAKPKTVKRRAAAKQAVQPPAAPSVAVVPAPAPPANSAAPVEPALPGLTDSQTGRQDWSRIWVVVIVLLLVAGLFYWLSRNFATATPAATAKSPKDNSPSSRGRGRPKGSRNKKGRPKT